MLERQFQSLLIKKLKERFPGCIVFKPNSDFYQGYPDLFILYNNKWAALECKKSKIAKHQPNQEYYINRLDEMSFSRFIYPENEKEVLNDLERAFES